MANQRILVVEDDPDGQSVMSYVLNYMETSVDIATTAEEACHLLFEEEQAYNAVIIDLVLPGMNGWQLLDMIQHDPRTAPYPCIAITGYHTSQIKEQAMRVGFVTYVTKPIHAPSLAETLASIIG